jgi:hypothetical protein
VGDSGAPADISFWSVKPHTERALREPFQCLLSAVQ